MHIVIKGTKTVEEFKERESMMKDLSILASNCHKEAFSEWKEGEIEKVWFDSSENLCIEYTSGKWWHYGCESGNFFWW